MWSPGDRVEHPAHGQGRVLRVLSAGQRLLVAFPSRDDVPWLILSEELGPSPALGPPPALADPRPTGAAVHAADARASLEALRLGVVPERALGALTVGREGELAAVDRTLAAGRGLRAVLGSYGAGKTQLLALVGARATAAGFLCARVSFDPVERPPSHPLRLYSALMADLETPHAAERGLGPVLRALGPDPRMLGGPLQHRWLSAALWAVHFGAPALAEQVLDFVEARSHHDPAEIAQALHRAGYRGPRPLGLPDYRTFGQIMAHLLSGLATWAAAAGHAGLVLLLDEAEVSERMAPTSRAFATEVLRYLAVTACEAPALAFSPAALSRGGHPAHQAIPPCAFPAPPVVIFTALTPDPSVEDALRQVIPEGDAWLRLPLLGPRSLPALASRVEALVRAAWPELPPDPAFSRDLDRALLRAAAAGQVQTPREAARALVEAWDLWRWRPPLARRALGLEDA